MKYKIYGLLGALILVGVAGCKKEVKDPKPEQARVLFERTCSLTRSYIDSVKVAKDTTNLNLLMEHFEERVDNLNMSLQADIDYSLTESENDTIMMLLDRLAKTRKERLQQLISHPDTAATAPSTTVK